MKRIFSLALAGLLLIGCRNSAPGGATSTGPSAPAVDGLVDNTRAQCVLNSPYLEVGKGLDAPGRIADDTPAVTPVAGTCAGNTQFRFGSGLYDITGVIANTGGMGWEDPSQVLSGLHMRQYARAFALESPCNSKRVIFVSTDTGMVFGSVRLFVLNAIAADPELSKFYGPDNVMLSATHTHSGPAGYSHYEAYNTLHYGYDDDTFQVIAQGVFEAIKRAHANLQTHPQTAPIALAVGELLDTNLNRSKPAFVMNTEAERREFVNARGEDVQVDKRFVQLNLLRDGGSAVGVINWFGVHPTVIGQTQHLVSGDNKGFASLGFEKIMHTRYDAAPGDDSFVAAFAQTNEGDSSPNLFIEQFAEPDPARGGGKDDFESNAISGTKQLVASLKLFGQGTPLSGPVDYRFFHVKIDEITITDEAVLASLRHPPELDTADKRTCGAVLGPSFAAGAEDGPGPTTEGVSCKSSPDVIAAATADAQTLMNANPATFPDHTLPVNLVATALLCQGTKLPGLNLGCQAEKPLAIPLGPPSSSEPNILPFQLFRIGNLAIVGLPWEVTTMSARRIRKTLLEVLAPAGIDTVVIAGLANEFVHYLTTREEYSTQQYEGASTLFGPWTLAAVQQETRKLALAMRDGAASPDGPDYVDVTPRLVRPPYNPSDTPASPTGSFGALVADVPASVTRGDTVRAEFQAGHPRNDLRTQASYVYAERQTADAGWEVVATDRDPELIYIWKPRFPSPLPLDPPFIGPSTAEAAWTIPRDTPAGSYRLRHVGASKMTPLLDATSYEGVSSAFTLTGEPQTCP
ncbi:MAG: neutral/alkaline non-lysosomal ceramidase N-terminal domain-containing protein [Pseudomonadota bacterium]